MQLVIDSRPSNLFQEFNPVGFRRRSVLKTFVASCAHGVKIAGNIQSTFRLINNMPNRQPGFDSGMKWVTVSSRYAAHLASKAISLEHKGSCFFRDIAGNLGKPNIGFEQILTWFQMVPILMGQDLIPMFVPKLAKPPRPLGRAPRSIAYLFAAYNFPGISQQKLKHTRSGTNFFLYGRLFHRIQLKKRFLL